MFIDEIVGEIVTSFAQESQKTVDAGKIWKQKLIPLLVVNKIFFDATIGWLWQTMESFLPCIRLIAPMPEGGPTPKVRAIPLHRAVH